MNCPVEQVSDTSYEESVLGCQGQSTHSLSEGFPGRHFPVSSRPWAFAVSQPVSTAARFGDGREVRKGTKADGVLNRSSILNVVTVLQFLSVFHLTGLAKRFIQVLL